MTLLHMSRKPIGTDVICRRVCSRVCDMLADGNGRNTTTAVEKLQYPVDVGLSAFLL